VSEWDLTLDGRRHLRLGKHVVLVKSRGFSKMEVPRE
jgi:hypothetical protein